MSSYYSIDRGLYLAIKIDRHEGPQTPLTIALHRDFYLAIKIDGHEGPQTPLIIALLRGL
jgi:hypothetical protein